MEVSELYTPLSEALAELERRQGDTELRRKVDEYFKDYPPLPEFAQGPRAVMARPLFSPTLELLYFLDICKHLPLKPILYEFTDGKFVSVNIDKKYLGKMVFFKNGLWGVKTITDTVKVIDFTESEGKPIKSMRTLGGENFVDFHHRLLHTYVKDFDVEMVSISDWFTRSHLFNSVMPYERYLGLFLADGILFENYTLESHESTFTNGHVIPTFKKLISEFGLKPLIVPLSPRDTEDKPFWCYYPDDVKALL